MTDADAKATRMAVCADPAGDRSLLDAAARLALDLGLPLAESACDAGWDMLLVATPGRLEVRVLRGDEQLRGGRPVYAELGGVDATSPAGRSLKQPLAKAVGIKSGSDRPTVIDATGGWGEDSWLMASLGCHVLTVERDRVMATLLKDGLLRAGAVQPEMLARMSVVCADGRHLLRRLSRIEADHEAAGAAAAELPAEMRDFLEPDVVYLDPMFPGAESRKTAERKPMRVLRRLVGEDADAAELFHWARRAARRRVVVKRPMRGAMIVPDVAPMVVHKGKSLRYDVYAPLSA